MTTRKREKGEKVAKPVVVEVTEDDIRFDGMYPVGPITFKVVPRSTRRQGGGERGKK